MPVSVIPKLEQPIWTLVLAFGIGLTLFAAIFLFARTPARSDLLFRGCEFYYYGSYSPGVKNLKPRGFKVSWNTAEISQGDLSKVILNDNGNEIKLDGLTSMAALRSWLLVSRYNVNYSEFKDGFTFGGMSFIKRANVIFLASGKSPGISILLVTPSGSLMFPANPQDLAQKLGDPVEVKVTYGI